MTTVVVGAGQAGLAVSHQLGEAGVDHVVLERYRVAQAWRGRLDSFTLVTPNWTLGLPGKKYERDDQRGTWTATPSSSSSSTMPTIKPDQFARGCRWVHWSPGRRGGSVRLL
jgi:cation diffusion facilitator CzcD-associated flavoprotein CzcO